MLRRLLTPMVCVALLGGIFWLIHYRIATQRADASRDDTQPIPVLTAQSQRRDVPIYLDGLGTVQAFQSVTVHSMIDGPLINVSFHEGQDVHAGDILARIDPRPTQAALDQAIAKKAQDEATLANARLDLARYNKLIAQDSTSQQTAATQRATVAQQEAIVRQDQAAIDTATTNLSYTTITAPLTGRTGIRQLDQGNIIHTTDSNGLVVITQLQPISIVFSLPQQTLPLVAAALATGPTKVLASAQGTQLDQGTVAVLDNQVDSSTGTIKLKATFPNTHLTLWPGGFVNIRLLATTLPQALTVPPVAIQRGPNGPYVYVISDDNKAHRRPITIGHEDAQATTITAGLTPGETIVTDGAARLQENTTVTIANPPPIAQRGSSGAS